MIDWDTFFEVFYSCSFGYVGVLLRYHLNYAMIEIPNPKTEKEEMILSLFTLQTYLLPNILGCFAMGILVALTRQIKLFGGRKFFRDIHVGLCTGFCGSLTTFSSWLSTFHLSLFQEYWLLDLLCIVIEFCATWSFFCFGEYSCDTFFLLMRHFPTAGSAFTIQDYEPRLPMVSLKPAVTDRNGQSRNDSHETGEKSPPREPYEKLNYLSLIVGDEEECYQISHSHDPVEGNNKQSIENTDENGSPADIQHEGSSIIERRTSATNISIRASDSSPEIQDRNLTERCIGYVTASLVVISLLILWIVILIDASGDNLFSSSYARTSTRSVAFAPFGVSLRYFLKKWENKTWTKPENNIFPWSTFLCNIAGASIAAGILYYALDWGWRVSFITGFLGSWTTVSSMIREIEDLHLRRGKWGPIYALLYTFLSFGVAIMFVQFIRLYGFFH